MMELFTIARKTDEKGNKEYQIGGNTTPILAIQMIFEASMAIAIEKGRRQAQESKESKKKEK